MSRNAQQKPNIFSIDYMPVMALISSLISRDWEIIVLFSMYRYTQSCAFISVIELPRIPAFYPKKLYGTDFFFSYPKYPSVQSGENVKAA